MGTTVSCFKLDRIDRRLLFLLYCLTFAVLGSMAAHLSIAPVIDEVGVMANSAFLAGYDWSECVKAMGNFYYKPGASLFYLPFFLIFDDPAVIYCCCVMFNMAILSFVPVFGYAILRKWLLPSVLAGRTASGSAGSKQSEGGSSVSVLMERIVPAVISLAVGLLPSVTLQSMYAKTEGLLIFLAWVMFYLMFAGTEADLLGLKGRSHRLSVITALVALYSYFVHTRGIVLLIAVVIVNICMQIFMKRRTFEWIPFIISFAAFFVIQMVFCEYVKAGVNIYGTDHNTLASAGLGELKKLFTYSGVCTMIKMVIGWFYNAFVSTYGMAIIGLLVCLYYIFNAFGKGWLYGADTDRYACDTAAAAFAFLNFAGCFAMGLLFFFQYGQKFFTTKDGAKVDYILFGRYMLCAVGPLVLISLFCLVYRSDLAGLKTKLTAVLIYAAVFVLFVFYVSPWLEGRELRSRYVMSLCTFLELTGPGKTTGIYEGMNDAFRYAGELAGAVFIVLLVLSCIRSEVRGWGLKLRRSTKYAAGLVIAAVAVVYSSVIIGVNFSNIRLSRDTFLAERVEGPAGLLNEIAEKTDLEERYPYVFFNKPTIDIKSFQSALMKYRLGSTNTSLAKMDNMFVVSENGVFKEKYWNEDYYTFDCYDYEGHKSNMIYVKGDELAAALEEAGYKMTKYTGKLTK